MRRLDRRPGVTVTGFVDDPIEFLERADVVVAPMRYGAGLQNKVLEAMGLGNPVVTTSLGQEGIEAETASSSASGRRRPSSRRRSPGCWATPTRENASVDGPAGGSKSATRGSGFGRACSTP